MSQDYLDPEILSDFFVEAKEHLETIEPNLLQLEKSPENLGLLNEIFRPMHSLKGASGFLGLHKINGLAHKAENILDELRQGAMAVNSSIMDIILSATDALRTMVDNLETTGQEGDVDTSDIIARIESALAGELPSPVGVAAVAVPAADPESVAEPEPEPVPETYAELEALDPAPAQSSGLQTIRWQNVVYDPAPDFDLTPYALTTVGEGHLTDFLEEARDLVSNLNQGLLDLEKNPDDNADLVNDIFRYFHNIKGNSGIIGYRDLNALTHEAETLLNRVRKGEMQTSRGIIDLLLAVVDLIEELLGRIDSESGKATPRDISMMASVLQATTEAGALTVPEQYLAILAPEFEGGGVAPAAPPEPVPAETVAAAPVGEPSEPEPAAAASGGYDPEDVAIFEQAVVHQHKSLDLALEMLRKDPDQRDLVDGLFRSLTTLQNSCGYMGLAEVKGYAERTAGLVDQARKSDIGFELMLDILEQEIAILKDMVFAALERIKGGAATPDVPAPASKTEAAAPTPEAAPEAKPEALAPKPAAAALAPEPKPEPAPKAEAKPAPEPKPEPAPKAEAKPAPEPKPEPAPKPTPKTAPATAPKPAPADASTPPKTAAQAAFEAGQPPPQRGATTIRVDHEKLDHLMNLIGELIINRNRYSMIARALAEGQQDVPDVAQQLTETTYAMARISDDLQDTIMKVRMVPVHTVFSRFPRLVRDLSRKSGKQVELITEGEDTELDKSVGEEIGDPLVHLIRNSLDHGLEPEDERIAAGKNPKGHVWLRAYHKGNSVAIEVEDDGRGIDPEKMRQVGVKKGLVTAEEAKLLDDRQAVDLIFAPGFSSAEKITDVSGRGVGMDVVKTNIKNLKGNIQINTEAGRGTRFTLTLPLTLAIIDALMVQIGKDVYAIPLDAVSETTKIEVERLSEVNHRKALTLRGEVLGIIELSDLLGLPPNPEQRDILPVVIIHDNDRRLGIVVDRLLERQEIVIKPLGQYLNTFEIRGISGATIMGDGSVVLILDPHEVYRLATATTKQGAHGD
jgi:two-component system chemotaxis sensor kinase CheA